MEETISELRRQLIAATEVECPASFVPVEMRQTETMKGLEKLYQLEG